MNNRLHRALPALLLIAAAATLSACSTGSQSMARNDWINDDGLPHNRYRVGGGIKASFTAPVRGVAIFVEANEQKWLKSQGLEVGEEFEPLQFGSLETFEQVVGGPPSEARFALYFVPLEDMGYGSVKQAEQNAPQADAAQR